MHAHKLCGALAALMLAATLAPAFGAVPVAAGDLTDTIDVTVAGDRFIYSGTLDVGSTSVKRFAFTATDAQVAKPRMRAAAVLTGAEYRVTIHAPAALGLDADGCALVAWDALAGTNRVTLVCD